MYQSDAPVKVLVAGDQFETVQVLEYALRESVPDVRITELSSSWPITPMGDIDEVHVAVGDVEELIRALQGVQVCVSHTYPFTNEVFEACPDLEQVTITRGGPVNVDIESATRHGVRVTYTPGRNATATAEHTIAMIMAAVRQIPAHHELLASGVWEGDAYRYDQVGMEIKGNDVGIVGCGAVGCRVAAVMAAMGATVRVFDPWATPDSFPAGVMACDDLDEVLRLSRILTLHARANEDNRHMIGVEQLAEMPDGSVLVNCARGSLVDYDAVCDALENGHLYAAAFDCLPQEPLPEDSRLLATSRVVLTPHIAGASRQAAELAARIAADDVAAFMQGRIPKYLANPDVID